MFGWTCKLNYRNAGSNTAAAVESVIKEPGKEIIAASWKQREQNKTTGGERYVVLESTDDEWETQAYSIKLNWKGKQDILWDLSYRRPSVPTANAEKKSAHLENVTKLVNWSRQFDQSIGHEFVQKELVWYWGVPWDVKIFISMSVVSYFVAMCVKWKENHPFIAARFWYVYFRIVGSKSLVRDSFDFEYFSSTNYCK